MQTLHKDTSKVCFLLTINSFRNVKITFSDLISFCFGIIYESFTFVREKKKHTTEPFNYLLLSG